jgi:acyl-coenzyme A thioesterase PaaI-like protein
MTDLITVEGGPERFFRVSRPTADGEVISSSLPAGPWLNGPSGRPLAGALGVLIDNVAGYVLVLGRPPGGWSVSAEITLDLMRPLLADGSVLTAQGVVRHADDVGGFASASITGASGQLVAADAAARGGYMSGGGYGVQHGRPMGRGHLEHDVYPLDGSVSPRILDSALTDRLTAFTWDGIPGRGIFEFALTRSPAYTYKPTQS